MDIDQEASTRLKQDPSRLMTAPVPKELAIAASVLVVMMMLTSLALWFVAGAIDQEHGQSNGAIGAVPTEQLLQTLAEDLGPHATSDDLQEAVATWLAAATDNETHIEFASALRGA